MPKSKKRPSIHTALQNAIVAAINDPAYSFSLPRLADWDSVVASTADEKQRLEFLGDALMHLSVALCLYRLFPDASPGFYTNIRSAVNTNATFTHLMIKAGAYTAPSQPHTTKVAADSFEVIVAALYSQRGFTDVCAWVHEQYAPLIAAARESYNKCLASNGHNNIPAKRRMRSLDPARTPLLKKIRLSRTCSSPQRTLMAQRVISHMKSKGKVKLCLSTRKSKTPLGMRLRSRGLRMPEPQGPSLVIDLTLDSDPNEPATASSQSPQPSNISSEMRHTQVRWQSATLPQPSSRPLSSSTVSSSDHINMTTVERFKRSSPQSDIPPGTSGNPIEVEDSDPEE